MQKQATSSPTVLRMIIARQLQVLRENAGLSYDQAAAAIYTSAWTIRRMERPEGGLKLHSVRGLLKAYGIHDEDDVQAFIDLVREANRPGWWHSYAVQFVPELLQTTDYARAVIAAGFPGASAEETDRRVALRMARQAILSRPDPPRICLVIDEAALRRPVGGPSVMRAQIAHLIDGSRQAGTTIQVLPRSAGAHPGMCGQFYLLRFGSPELPDIVYAEHLTGAFYLDKPDEVTAHVDVLDRLAAQATPADQTEATLNDIRKEL